MNDLAGIIKGFLQRRDDTVDVVTFLKEPEWLAESQFADDIEGI